MSETIPIIKPIDEKVFNFKQSKYDNVPKVPFRSIILGPSGSGKFGITSFIDIRHL